MSAGWQPIETAPRAEGEDVFLWNGVVVTIGSTWESGWADLYCDWLMPQPTHWCPVVLPNPPGER